MPECKNMQTPQPLNPQGFLLLHSPASLLMRIPDVAELTYVLSAHAS